MVICLALLLAAVAAPGAGDLLYVRTGSVTMPSTDTGWDYARMEPGGSRLFAARGADGLTVFDVDTQKPVAQLANSTGANGPLLIPQHDRGYVAMTDGSLLSFHLKSLKPIARIKLSRASGLNSAVYDPLTQRVHAITASGTTQTTWFTLDAASGKLLGTKVFPFGKMDDPANDGRGHLFAPARHDRIVLKLDGRTLAEQARWPVPCDVSKVRFQASTNRILAACYGMKPLFFALDAATGKIVASLPIGMGIDGLAIDEARRRIVVSNGEDATLTVIAQDGPDTYRSLGTVSTRPAARMMAMDERTGKLLLVYADYTEAAPVGAAEPKTSYHPDSFTILTYEPR